MESNLKLNSFREALELFGSRTTAHGLCQIDSSTTKTRKVFWVLLSLAALGVSARNIVGLVQEYFTFPVTTEVRVVYESRLEFPSVTVCNMNQFKRSRLHNDSTMKTLSVSNICRNIFITL